MIIEFEEYNYFRNEVLKRKTKPYVMSNVDYAKEMFNRFKLDYPHSSIYFLGIHQFICYDNKAKNNLLKMINEQKKRKEEELKEINNLISDLK